MLKSNLMSLFLLSLLIALPITAQEVETEEAVSAVKTSDTNVNPISPVVFCADPTTIEYEGRVYVYATNDHQQFIANGKKGSNNYGAIKTLVVFSSADMVNWTYHGTIPVGSICGSWCYASWAPSIVSRMEDDGLTHFYLYFSNSGGGVGVITATNPLGPWKSPLRQSLVSHSTPGVGDCSAPFDPGVVIDDNGVGWLAFGGGDPNKTGSKLMPGNARIIKLGKNMVTVVGKASEIKAPYMFEASELNYINGQYVYTYCTNWSAGENWSSYGSSAAAPTACCMAYMVNSGDPLDTDSWSYRNEYFANPGRHGYNYSNNHTHLQKFNGAYYLFYHTMSLEKLLSSPGDGFRSVQVNRAPVIENSAHISATTANDRGPTQLGRVNPYQWQEAEMMSNCGGLQYSNLVCAANSSTNSTAMGSLALTSVSAGSWVMVRGVNFNSSSDILSFAARISGKGILEVRLDRKDAKPSAILEFDNTKIAETTVEGLDASAFSGIHNVYLFFASAKSVKFDAWTFTDGTVDAIEKVPERECYPVREEYFDLSGRRVDYRFDHFSGRMLIRRTVMDDGTIHTDKIVE